MSARVLTISTVLATAALAAGYSLSGGWLEALLVGALGTFWLLGQRRGWGWVTSMALALLVGAASIGPWLGVGPGWMLVGIVAALSAWDLDHFTRRLRNVERVENAQNLERRHLQRLLIVDTLGLLLGAVALSIRAQFGFGTAFLLGLLAILALSRVIRAIRQESD